MKGDFTSPFFKGGFYGKSTYIMAVRGADIPFDHFKTLRSDLKTVSRRRIYTPIYFLSIESRGCDAVKNRFLEVVSLYTKVNFLNSNK